ncbi:hypothetical protein SDJN03_03006, partial [Cucurbita argyrosperma subsp. sororia]
MFISHLPPSLLSHAPPVNLSLHTSRRHGYKLRCEHIDIFPNSHGLHHMKEAMTRVCRSLLPPQKPWDGFFVVQGSEGTHLELQQLKRPKDTYSSDGSNLTKLL